tara:strand:+ start:256 stop:744 length:489 start_codon:yes stop_codon:yes gene_type:complete
MIFAETRFTSVPPGGAAAFGKLRVEDATSVAWVGAGTKDGERLGARSRVRGGLSRAVGSGGVGGGGVGGGGVVIGIAGRGETACERQRVLCGGGGEALKALRTTLGAHDLRHADGCRRQRWSERELPRQRLDRQSQLRFNVAAECEQRCGESEQSEAECGGH